MNNNEEFQKNENENKNQLPENGAENSVENNEKVIEQIEGEYAALQERLQDTAIPGELRDEKLKEAFATERESLKNKLNAAVSQLKEGIARLFSKQKLSDEEVMQYQSYLEGKKEALLKNRIFYKGQDLNDPHEGLWKEDLQKYKSPLLGVYGKTGDYLAQIAALDEASPTSRLAKNIHDLGTINDVRLNVSDAPSGFAGSFINIGDPFKIAKGERKFGKNEAYIKTFVEMVGAERRFVTTLLHESIHALVMYRLNSPKTPEDRLVADKLFTVFNEVKKVVSPVQQQQYGFTDLDEFMAEFFTNGEFRRTVSNIPVDREQLDKNYAENYQIEQFIRIKTRNLVEAVLQIPNPADSTALQGLSHDLIRDLTAELLGADIYVEALEEDLETQGTIDLAKKEWANSARDEA